MQMRSHSPGTRFSLNMEQGSVELSLERSFEFQLKLSETESEEERLNLLKDYIKEGDNLLLPKVPEFDKSELIFFSWWVIIK